MNATGPSYNNLSDRRQFLRTAAVPLAALAMPGLSGLARAAPAAPWRMRLVFSSVMLAELPIEDVCARAAKMGFEAIDIWCPFDRCKHLADVVARLGPDGLKQLLFFYAWQSADGINQLPGHGPADFLPWLKALANINYQGFLSPFMHGHPTPEELTAGVVKACGYLKDCHTRAIG